MICYHSTTKSSIKSILNGDMDVKPATIWNVSDDDGCFYVWPTDKFIEANGYDGDDVDYLEPTIINQVFESGILQTLTNDDDEVFVIKLDIPDELLQDDYSCNNMNDVASFIMMGEFDTDMIVGLYRKRINKWHKPFILANVMDNPNFTDCYIDYDLCVVAESLGDCLVPEEIYDIDYTEVNLKDPIDLEIYIN